MAHIPSGSGTYLNLDEEMITRGPIIETKLNLRLNHDSLDRIYRDYQTDTFKVYSALQYQILSKMFMDRDVFVYVKQKRSMQDGQAVFVNANVHFFSPDCMAR